MIKRMSFLSILYIFFILFIPDAAKANLSEIFKKQQDLKSNCDFQSSNFLGISPFGGSVNDERFCFSGNNYIQYSNLFPNGEMGGILNKPSRGANYGDRNTVFQRTLEDGYLMQYECSWDQSQPLKNKCDGPVRSQVIAARDYLAFYEVAQGKKDNIEAINLYEKSRRLNPKKTDSQKELEAETLATLAFIYFEERDLDTAIEYSNLAFNLTKKNHKFYTYIRARAKGIIALSKYGINKNIGEYCKYANEAASISNFESQKGWFISKDDYLRVCK